MKSRDMKVEFEIEGKLILGQSMIPSPSGRTDPTTTSVRLVLADLWASSNMGLNTFPANR